MNRNDFGPWGVELEPAGFYRALAAAGVLGYSHPPPSAYGNIEQNISESIERGSPLPWRIPTNGNGGALNPGAPSRLLADAWAAIVRNYSEPIGETYFSRNPNLIRLELVSRNIADIFWLSEQLSRPEVGATSVYGLIDDELNEIAWDWPLRVGFLGDVTSCQLRAQLVALSIQNYWINDLVKFVDLQTGQGECDLLLLPYDLRSAVSTILQASTSLTADCVLVLGRIDDTEQRAVALIDALRTQTRASGIGLTHVPAAAAKTGLGLRPNWFKELIRQISHNQPIDVALYRACRNREVKVRTPLLFATRQLVESSLISRSIEKFANQVSHPELREIEIVTDPENPEWTTKTLGPASRGMAKGGGKLPWDHESDTATTFAHLKDATRMKLESLPAPTPKTRWIQTEVWEHGEGEMRAVKQVLKAEMSYRVGVYIGATSDDSIPADRPFNEEALPPDSNEHRLTVVFSEPQISPEPQVATIVLPRQGDSSRCDFYIHLPSGISSINARIVILHRNRILQTALLQASVIQGEYHGSASDDGIKLIIESVIRPGMQDLTNRTWFDGAFVLNHAANGTAQITKAVGEQVTRVQIAGLAATVSWFDDQITEVAEKWKKLEPLESKKSRNLLWSFAMNGSALFDGLVQAQRADDALITASRIQVLSAAYGARFPLEFVYGRMAPLPEAPLCPKAKESLISGRCDASCPTGEDEEKVICPLGFWGLNRVIERHAYDPECAKDLAGADFGMQCEPATGRNRLNVLASALVAVSDNVDQVVPGSKQSVLDALDNATKKQSRCVPSWADWVSDIADRSPSLLVLLPHTLKEVLSKQQTLEISADQRLIYGNLQKKHVLGKTGLPHPVVILMGCKTAAPDIPYESFVLKFRLYGAALVIGTGSTILGRHAATVTQNFINDLAAINSSNVSFGELMLKVRRQLVADGLLMALCLTSYGDTDWLM